MPLYGSKLFQTNPPSPVKTENGAENTVYEIDFTGEKFTDQAIYEETLKLYNERVWTDRCTGEGSRKSGNDFYRHSIKNSNQNNDCQRNEATKQNCSKNKTNSNRKLQQQTTATMP